MPADNLLGELGRGFRNFLQILDDGRIAIAALALGCARACLEHAVEYAKQRQAFGGPIGRYQGLAFQLADLAVAVENAHNLIYKAAWLKDRGRPIRQAAAMAKLYSTETAVTATRVGDAGVRWRRVHRGDADRAVLSRRQDPRDRRRHQRDPAARPGSRAGSAGRLSSTSFAFESCATRGNPTMCRSAQILPRFSISRLCGG